MGEFAGSTTAHQRGPTCCTSWLPVCSSSRAPAAVHTGLMSEGRALYPGTNACSVWAPSLAPCAAHVHQR